MSTAEMRRKIKKTVDTLSSAQLKAAAQLLRQLQEEQNATDELLSIPGFRESFRRGLRDIAAGRVTPVDKLRRKR